MATKIVVRYAETDQMKIAHHSNYAIWYEAARTEAIKEFGISYGECEKMGFMLPLIGLECKYIKPALYEDVLLIETYIEKLTAVRLTMAYEVRKEGSEEIIATGKTMHVWTDLSLRPLNIKKKNNNIYNAMLQGVR